MKEALTSPYNKIVFRETFNSEQAVRNNGGVPTAVTISKGIGSFNGTTSEIVYPKNFNGTYSIRIRFKEPTSFSSAQYLCDFRQGTGVGFVYCSETYIISPGGTKYVNGVASTSSIAVKEIVVSGMTITSTEMTMGRRTAPFTSYFIGDLELFEIYEGVLTPSEVKNLYRNSWAKDDIKKDLLLDYDSTNGYITDRTGKNTLTATDVSIKKTGGFYSSEFNGSTSKIDTGSDFIGTKAVTICGWIYNTNSIGYQKILDNSKFRLGLHPTNTVQVTSDQVKFVYSPKTIPVNSWQFISITRKVDGKTSFYLGDKSNSPVLNGSVDLDSGTPTVAASNVFIGSHPSGTTFFYGNIPMLKVYEGILSLEDISAIWSLTKGKIQ